MQHENIFKFAFMHVRAWYHLVPYGPSGRVLHMYTWHIDVLLHAEQRIPLRRLALCFLSAGILLPLLLPQTGLPPARSGSRGPEKGRDQAGAMRWQRLAMAAFGRG